MIMQTSELDKAKSTITISLGTKNRLRKIKGDQSYEDYINYLLRLRNNVAHNQDNVIEYQKFERVKGIATVGRFKILFSYNKYNNSPSHLFDINIDTIRDGGMPISYDSFIKEHALGAIGTLLRKEYELYFDLLRNAIRNDIEPNYKHNGRIEDHYSWEQEFKILNLSKKALQEDVIEKLESYTKGVRPYD